MRRGTARPQYKGDPPNGAGPSFTPTDIANLALWLDAADSGTITLDGSSNVEEWRDKSGNVRHLTQGSTTLRPSRPTGILNGNPVVRSDGVDDTLASGAVAATGWFGASADQITYIHLCRYLNTGRFSTMLNASSAGTANRVLVDRNPGSDANNDFVITQASVNQVVTSAPLTGTAWFIETFRWTSGGTPTLRRRNTSGTNTYNAAGTFTATFSGNLQMYVGTGTLLPAEFDLAEHLIYARNLSDTEVGQIESYLLSKWGTI